jgi:hypothetical protein
MAKTNSALRQVVFLGTRKALLDNAFPPKVLVCGDRDQLEAILQSLRKLVTFVSSSRTFTDMLLERTVGQRVHPPRAELLTLTPPRLESIPALLGLFRPVFGMVEGFRWLPSTELLAVLLRADASDRFIGGSVDRKTKTLTLLRGNKESIVVPFSLFPDSGDGTKPDFGRLGFTDYGRTVALGDYEAAADAILYELDAEYRRRLNKQRRKSERSFGASLMRLRKQRRLKRTDFSPVSSKEIARIERNEVEKPHARTLQVITRRLGVGADEIQTY